MSRKVKFAISDSAKIKITNNELKEIKDLYKQASVNVGKKADKLPQKGSYILHKQQLNDYVKELKGEVTNVNAQIKEGITDGAKSMAKVVVDENTKFLGKLGINVSGAYNYVPDKAIKQIISGNVYNGQWKLSSAIWGTNQKQLHDIDKIVALGMAENKPMYDIIKDLEKYVDPTARKAFDWSRKYPGTNKVVDYNAYRLAKTMTNHAYQKAFQMTTEKNPFVTAYKWENGHAETAVCELCQELAGKDSFGLGPGVFPKDQVPMDHPNGYCFLTAIVADDKVITDRLADWVNGKDDPELDEFAKSMGLPIGDVKGGVSSKIKEKAKTISGPQYHTGVYNEGSITINGKTYNPDELIREVKGLDGGEAWEVLVYEQSISEEWIEMMDLLDEEDIFGGLDVNKFIEFVNKNAVGRDEIMLHGDFSKMFESFTEVQKEEFVRGLANGTPGYQRSFAKALDSFGGFMDDDTGAYYSSYGGRKININFEKVIKQCEDYDIQNKLHVLFHESGHMFDDILTSPDGPSILVEKISNQDHFIKSFEKDLKAIRKAYNDDSISFVSKWHKLTKDDNSRGIQDTFSGLNCLDKTKGGTKDMGLTPRWGHRASYWERGDTAAEIRSELWAHLSAAQASPVQREMMKDWFPNSLKAFEELLEDNSLFTSL